MMQMWTFWHLSYCTGSLSLESFLARCPFLLLLRMILLCTVINLNVLLLLYSLSWWWLINYTLLSLRYIFLALFCTFLHDIDLPHFEKLRETGYFFQALKLSYIVPLLQGSSVTHFMHELPVFASVNHSYNTAWTVWYLSIPQRSNALEWWAPCMKSSVALKGHFCASNWLVHAYCILGVGALLAHNVLKTNDNHRQSDFSHYFVMFFAQKSSEFWPLSWSLYAGSIIWVD